MEEKKMQEWQKKCQHFVFKDTSTTKTQWIDTWLSAKHYAASRRMFIVIPSDSSVLRCAQRGDFLFALVDVNPTLKIRFETVSAYIPWSYWGTKCSASYWLHPVIIVNKPCL